MITVSNACFRCTACVKACPVPGTITNVMPGKIRVNSFTCIGCEQCIPACPAGALGVVPDPVVVVFDLPTEPVPAKTKTKRR